MATLVLDTWVETEILEQRRASGGDKYDEVWDGVYVMAPLPNDEHQEIVMGVSFALQTVVGLTGLGRVRPGVNVSDQEVDWKQNYRCPDVVVYLNGTSAINRDTYWLGGPDFAVEVASKGDCSREKLEFYAKVNTRELLLIDRDPWTLELYRLTDGALTLVGKRTAGEEEGALTSGVVPLSFRLIEGTPRPVIEVGRLDGEGGSWRI